MMSAKYFRFFLLFLFTKCGEQAAVNTKQFLHEHKYLNSTNVDTRTMENALKMYQNASGLHMSGVLDEQTMKKMSLPRCGKASKIVIKVVQQQGDVWRKRDLTYKIRNGIEPFTISQIKSVFEEIINLWTKNVNLNITESRSDGADIDIYFTEQDGKLNYLGFANFPEDGDIYIDKSEDWALQKKYDNPDLLYFGWVAAHELGHSLGMPHADSLQSVMYPVYNTEQIEPSSLDRNNLIEFYGGQPILNNDELCTEAPIDALLYTNTRRHLIIKGAQYWTFTEENVQSGPYSLNLWYPGFPNDVDAAFSIGRWTYFFKKHVFYKFTANKKGYKIKLISTGFAKLPTDIDAAFFDPVKRTIHFFKGSKYYLFDISNKAGLKLANEGAEISESWSGIPNDIEAATWISNGTGLFIKGGVCYTVDLHLKKLLQSENCTTFYKCEN